MRIDTGAAPSAQFVKHHIPPLAMVQYEKLQMCRKVGVSTWTVPRVG